MLQVVGGLGSTCLLGSSIFTLSKELLVSLKSCHCKCISSIFQSISWKCEIISGIEEVELQRFLSQPQSKESFHFRAVTNRWF